MIFLPGLLKNLPGKMTFLPRFFNNLPYFFYFLPSFKQHPAGGLQNYYCVIKNTDYFTQTGYCKKSNWL